MPAGVDPDLLRQHRTHAGRWWVAALMRKGKTAEARARTEALLAEWQGRVPSPSMAFLLASLRHELIRMGMFGDDVPDLGAQRQAAERECELAAADPDFGPVLLELRVRIAMDFAEYRVRRGDSVDIVPELEAALQALGTAPATPDLVSLRALVLNRIADHARSQGDLETATKHFAAARAALVVPAGSVLGPPDWLSLRAHASWGLARVEFAAAEWDAAAPLLAEAAADFDRYTSAFPADALELANFAGLLTESAQVEERRGAAADAVLAMLERGRRLYRQAAGIGAAGAIAAEGRKTNLLALTERLWRQRDGAGLAAAAREQAAAGTGDAHQQSLAAWCLLRAAELLAAHGDAAAASACDDDALTALVACDAAGWFPPVNLDDAPCRRLFGRAEFDELRERHPPEQASRKRPK
jgi:hypothetical protein